MTPLMHGAVIKRGSAPVHLFSISELDFSEDLFADRVTTPWFRLGALTITPRRDERGVEDVISRQTLLLCPGQFATVFGHLESVGNVIGDLGKPCGSVRHMGDRKAYSYTPFHRFEMSFTAVVGEPVVFVHSGASGVHLVINPDLWLYFELEEKTPGNGIWWDPRRGVDALVQHVIDQGNVEVVELRADYLLKYLQARQMSLVIGHYRHLHLFDPSDCVLEAFVKEDLVLGSPGEGTKAILQNWGPRKDPTSATPFLQRRLHLWFEIPAPEIDVEDPWAHQPCFDPYTFTLSTHAGPVAPARWTHFQRIEGRDFEGAICNFTDRTYFRQEVLMKYEGASGYEVGDDGSVSCHHYWGLERSTARIGNELLSTAIGDFAEGVPFEEWPHWKQYSVDPPSPQPAEVLREEQSIPDAVNTLVYALDTLNTTFAEMAGSLGVSLSEPLWRGSLDSLAGRQLKWVYPASAGDDEFLKRATLASTLVIEALKPASLRNVLSSVDSSLRVNDEKPPRPLGSLNLLQRTTLIAVLVETFQPNTATIPILVKQAERKTKSGSEPDVQMELEKVYKCVREEFAPLAFLYDLRTYGGLAHAPNKGQAAGTAEKLGLPGKNWHRRDYLRLLELVKNSVYQISSHLDIAARMTTGRSAPQDE
jgi:hypothetical protein